MSAAEVTATVTLAFVLLMIDEVELLADLTLTVLPFAPTNVTKLPPVMLTLTLFPTVESL